MNSIDEAAAREETQKLITRLRGEINARITAEWMKPNPCNVQVRSLRAERDILLHHRETLDTKASAEIQGLMTLMEQRIQTLD
ncbi:hypothetical protein [Ottowia thiooxydans]|uniref:hypothetical protein n=1 Tax=Ottowia thiooxydans TaxID=219182 RepID=UPI000420B0AD|nr:hypothetical protein [Ottowia thiooxydans]